MTNSNFLTLVIVTYNSEPAIFKLLSSIENIKNLIKEIIIIDNNSLIFDKNKIQKISSKIKIIQNRKNYGFAKAVNQGIRICKSNYVLLLNPDTYLIDKSIINSFRIIKKDSRIGAIGGKILNEKLKNNFTANSKPSFLTGLFEFTNLKKIYPNNKYTSDFWIEKNKKINKPIDVSSLCGAYLLFRKKINNKLNLFNEKYFLYFEDIDFGIKINRLGYKVIFDPNSQIVHIGGHSSKNKYKTDLKHWYESREIFFKKLLKPIPSIILLLIFKIEKNILNLRNLIKNETQS